MNIYKRVFVLSVKLRNLTLKLHLEAASCMEPGLAQVMRAVTDASMVLHQ